MHQNEPYPGQTLKPGISVIVPVFNGEESIGRLAERLAASDLQDTDWELIFVVDGSPDQSWEIVQTLAQRDHRIRGLDLYRNFGQANATLAGIRNAQFDVTVTMDDDLQHHPESIPAMVAMLQPGVDLVYGRPFADEHSLGRNMASRVTKASISRLSSSGSMLRDSSALRAFRTCLREGFHQTNDPNASIDVMLTWVTTRFVVCEVAMSQREQGASGYSLTALVRHARNLVTGATTAPLRFASWVGAWLTMLGLGYFSIQAAGRVFAGNPWSNADLLVSLVLVIGGVQLLSLGVIGEYLSRALASYIGKPPYLVRSSVPPPPEHRDTGSR